MKKDCASRVVDLRSDTLTVPTPEMRKAMFEAEVGDDCHGEDPSVNRLEKIAAEIAGKEAAVFVPSGTMGNCASIMTLSDRAGMFIAERLSHVCRQEGEGIETVGGVRHVAIEESSGILSPEQVSAAIEEARSEGHDIRVLCLENTANLRGGVVTPADRMRELADVAHGAGLKVHLDGARMFNAATHLGCDVKELTRHVDTAMFCLSKGLCAPAGSMVAASKEVIQVVRRYRKMLGGAMRQAGILAAAGIIALTEMPARLHEDHENAKLLAERLAGAPGIAVEPEKVQTNIVLIDAGGEERAEALRESAGRRGIKFFRLYDGTMRLVTRNGITRDDVLRASGVIRRCCEEMS